MSADKSLFAPCTNSTEKAQGKIRRTEERGGINRYSVKIPAESREKIKSYPHFASFNVDISLIVFLSAVSNHITFVAALLSASISKV